MVQNPCQSKGLRVCDSRRNANHANHWAVSIYRSWGHRPAIYSQILCKSSKMPALTLWATVKEWTYWPYLRSSQFWLFTMFLGFSKSMACLFLWFLVPCYDITFRLRSIPYSNVDQGLDPSWKVILHQCGTRLYTKAESYIAARQAMTCRLASANQLPNCVCMAISVCCFGLLVGAGAVIGWGRWGGAWGWGSDWFGVGVG